jgi:hypothetical protein
MFKNYLKSSLQGLTVVNQQVPLDKKNCNYLEGPLKKSKSRAACEEDLHIIEWAKL